jgi:hypothetical protein
MTWVRIDDSFTDHPKVLAAGPLAALLQLRALCYSSRHLTDGFIPAGAVQGLIADLGHPRSEASGQASAQGLAWPEAMVEAGLWEKKKAGFLIHDYLNYNWSRDQILANREHRKEAGYKGGVASAQARAQAKVKQTGSFVDTTKTRQRTNSHTHTHVYPPPTPSQEHVEMESKGNGETPPEPTPEEVRKKLAELRRDHPGITTSDLNYKFATWLQTREAGEP